MNDSISTAEEKISKAAKELFYKKGYAKTTTREIVELAGVNIALLNYYYRSKERLFDRIMTESVHDLISVILSNINNRTLSLSLKIEIIVNQYLDVLTQNPYLPVFVLSELRDSPSKFLKKAKIPTDALKLSHINEQIEKQIKEKKLSGSALHYIINVLSMTVMPIALKDLLKFTYYDDEDQYKIFIEERRVLIPIWIKTILKLDE